MPRAPFLILFALSSSASAGQPKPLPPVVATILSPQVGETFNVFTEVVVLDSVLAPRSGHSLGEFLCRWTVDGEELSFDPPDAYGHCGAEWVATAGAHGVHVARLAVYEVPPQPGSLAQLIVAHNRGFAVAEGPVLEGLTGEVTVSGSNAVASGSVRVSDALVYSTAPLSWLDVEIAVSIWGSPTGSNEVWDLMVDSVNPALDGGTDGWVEVPFELDMGDPEGIAGCEVDVNVSVSENEGGADGAEGAVLELTLPVSASLAATWEDALGRGSLLWSSEDPAPGDAYSSYTVLGTTPLPTAVASMEVTYENQDNASEERHTVSCQIGGFMGPTVSCDVPAGNMGVGRWTGTASLYDSDGELICASPDSFDVELRPFDDVDNDGDLQSELDGDCDDLDTELIFDPTDPDDDCDTKNDGCDVDTIETFDGTLTGLVNDGNMDDEALFPDNDTPFYRVTSADFEAFPFRGFEVTFEGNQHRPGDQDWYLYTVPSTGAAPNLRVELEVPDDGTGRPEDTWVIGVLSEEAYDGGFARTPDNWGMGMLTDETPECGGGRCTLSFDITSDWFNFRAATSYWAVGVGHWDSAWDASLCDDEDATTPSVYALTVSYS